MRSPIKKNATPFSVLDQDTILDCVEKATGKRLLNLCRPHASYINRVYELQDESGEYLVVKFFRPGRWSRKGLQDELQFVRDCAEKEIPVIKPIEQVGSRFLGSCRGISFALYPRCGGRLLDEYDDEQWLEIGRLLGRVHQVGAEGYAYERNRLHPLSTTRAQVDAILDNNLVPDALVPSFSRITEAIITEITRLFVDIDEIRIHGDCHGANLIYRPGESFYLIDFDDMAVGPAVQDLWMLLPGKVADSRFELGLMLEGYETFRPFDRSTLNLIEPLRAMRYIHYISWCGWQYLEDGGTRIDDSFGSYAYWQREISDLEDQFELICKQQSGLGGL